MVILHMSRETSALINDVRMLPNIQENLFVFSSTHLQCVNRISLCYTLKCYHNITSRLFYGIFPVSQGYMDLLHKTPS